jgi:competence ComEA-like helix-hairpin-helix protein
VFGGLLAFFVVSAWVYWSNGPAVEKGGLRVNINSASLEQLQSPPGVGPARARSIVASRPYSGVAELARVRGIGVEQVAQTSSLLTVSDPTRQISGATFVEKLAARAAGSGWRRAALYYFSIAIGAAYAISWFRMRCINRKNMTAPQR